MPQDESSRAHGTRVDSISSHVYHLMTWLRSTDDLFNETEATDRFEVGIAHKIEFGSVSVSRDQFSV